MPIYDYQCRRCGPFRGWGRMAEADAPAACPVCSAPAPRAITAPYLNDMNPHSRIAHQRNARSAHEPRVMSRADLQASSRGGDCGHAHHHHGDAATSAAGRRLEGKRSGNMKRSPRPWMVGH